MNVIECIKAVNKDTVSAIKNMVMGIPSVFTIKFWNDNGQGFVILAAVVAYCASFLGVLVGGVYLSFEYFPANDDARLWLPIIGLWIYFFVVIYIFALIKKCKES